MRPFQPCLWGIALANFNGGLLRSGQWFGKGEGHTLFKSSCVAFTISTRRGFVSFITVGWAGKTTFLRVP